MQPEPFAEGESESARVPDNHNRRKTQDDNE